MNRACISAIEYYLPEKVLTNEDLSRDFPEWSPDKILSKTGIARRHIAAPGESEARAGGFRNSLHAESRLLPAYLRLHPPGPPGHPDPGRQFRHESRMLGVYLWAGDRKRAHRIRKRPGNPSHHRGYI